MPVVAEESGTPSAAVELPVLRLKRGEDRRLRAGHLWVFSNEVDNEATPLTEFAVGAVARVLSERDLFLGYAYVNPHALICARILSRSPVHPIDRSLLVHRLKVALALRERHFPVPHYRLVFGESDGPVALAGQVSRLGRASEQLDALDTANRGGVRHHVPRFERRLEPGVGFCPARHCFGRPGGSHRRAERRARLARAKPMVGKLIR